jgi:cation transport regulator ChaC
MADLKVDYQLLASIHATMTGLSTEFETIEDQASAYASAYGYEAITSAMSSFSGNWSSHRQKLLATMQSLDHMVVTTSQDFHRADTQLATSLASSGQPRR